jgi:hypothetical protein
MLLGEANLSRPNVREIEGRSRMARIEDCRQPNARLQGTDPCLSVSIGGKIINRRAGLHDSVHIIVNDVARNFIIYRVDDIVVSYGNLTVIFQVKEHILRVFYRPPLLQ